MYVYVHQNEKKTIQTLVVSGFVVNIRMLSAVYKIINGEFGAVASAFYNQCSHRATAQTP